MADIEKVIKGLEKWIDDPMAQNAEIEPQLVHEALELLKEQEAVEPFSDDDGAYWCRSCHEDIVWHQKFCSNCGKPVLWGRSVKHGRLG